MADEGLVPCKTLASRIGMRNRDKRNFRQSQCTPKQVVHGWDYNWEFLWCAASVFTDAQGKRQKLEAVPRQLDKDISTPAPFDFGRLFQAAGLDQSRFQPAAPQWTPLAPFDDRKAWTGTAVATGDPLRVEAAAWRGRPVFFRIVGPWSHPERDQAGGGGDPLLLTVVKYLALIASLVLTWHNVRTGKADLRGGAKLAAFYFCTLSGASLLQAHHAAVNAELTMFWIVVSNAGFNALALGIFYTALEPWVRKRWPQSLISWSRLTTLGPRDPQVGQALLLGVVFGCLLAVVGFLRLHGPGGEPMFAFLYPLMGLRQALGGAMNSLTGSLFDSVFVLLVLFLVRVILRKQWLATGVFILLMASINSVNSSRW